MKIELSIDEANTLLNLIDMAVKSGGLRVAGAALPLVMKLEAAAKEEQTEKEPE